MRIFSWEIKRFNLSDINNKDEKRPVDANLLDKIVKIQLFRSRESIVTWREGQSQAESVLNPDRTVLIRVFKDIIKDGHLASLMRTIKNEVASSPFIIENASGTIDEEAIKRFKKQWFFKVIDYIVEADFFGYSLIQLGDIKNDTFTNVKLVPREYIIPEYMAVKKNLLITKSDLTKFGPGTPYENWTIWVNDEDSLGMLDIVAPNAIWKRGVMSAWAEAGEVFGQPIQVGKTDTNNPVAYKNLINFFAKAAGTRSIVVDNEDSIEFVETASTDYFQVYDKFIERNNSEMSKAMLGQTMTSDDGSSRSQAEVHKDILKTYTMSVKRRAAAIVNDDLFVKMVIHGILPSGSIFYYDDDEKVDIETKFKWAMELVKSGKYAIDAEWFENTFGIPLEEALEQEKTLPGEKKPKEATEDKLKEVENVASVMATVDELYKETKHDHSH